MKMCQKAMLGGSHVTKAMNVSWEKPYSQGDTMGTAFEFFLGLGQRHSSWRESRSR
jgi:hypothetical protein